MPAHITPQRIEPNTSQNSGVVAVDRRAAGRLVAGPQVLALAEAADRLVDHAEAPGGGADPAQVLHRIADVGDLPVEHGAHAVRADDQVAVAKVAVHQASSAPAAAGSGPSSQRKARSNTGRGQFEAR